MKMFNDTANHSGDPAGWRFGSPDAVVADPTMTTARKRELLASWASDARAVENAPAWRRLDHGALVAIDDVLDALKALDRVGVRRRPGREDDDDDPPAAPAMAMPRPLPPLGGDRLAAAA
jgi:hypothetical protein